MKDFLKHQSPRRVALKIALPVLVMVVLLLLTTASFSTTPALANGVAPTAKQLARAQEPDAQVARITINPKKKIGKIPANVFGLWVGNSGHDRPEPMYFYRTPEGKAKLLELAPGNLYYSTDMDNWAASYDPFNALPRVFPNWMDSTEFISLNQDLGSEPILSVNITNMCEQADVNLPPSSGNVNCQLSTYDQAVSWIAYLKSINAPIKNVALGLEPYAGCAYWTKGINCTDKAGRHRISLPQEEYAARAKTWAKAIKAVNPAAKIGVHLQPNTYLCKRTIELFESDPQFSGDVSDLDLSSEAAAAACGDKEWDQVVLKKVGKFVDFVLVHQYFVLRSEVSTEAAGQKYSYYQEQINMRVSKNGVTAFPSQIRQELLKWAPKKKNVPIVVDEFNASYAANLRFTQEQMYTIRQSLYTGLATGELYLDLIQPVQTAQGRLKGASYTILLGMFIPQLTLTRMANPLDPESTVYMPSWHVLSMLKPVQGKNVLTASIINNPQTAVNRPALSMYAFGKGKQAWLVVFNHHTRGVKSKISLPGAKIKSVNGSQLGKNAGGFLGMNTIAAPNAITPQSVTVPRKKIAKGTVKSFKFPAHSLTVLQIQMK